MNRSKDIDNESPSHNGQDNALLGRKPDAGRRIDNGHSRNSAKKVFSLYTSISLHCFIMVVLFSFWNTSTEYIRLAFSAIVPNDVIFCNMSIYTCLANYHARRVQDGLR